MPDSTEPHRGAAFALLAAVQIVLTAAIALTLLALPAIQRDLGLSAASLVLVSAAPGLSFSGLLLLGGRLADMFGRRRLLVIGLAIFGLGSAVAGLAPGVEALLVGRFAQGCGGALAAPAAMALLGTLYPDQAQRDRVVAVWGNLSPLGATLGVLLSGAIVTWVSWRWSFAIPVVVATAATIAAPRLLPAGPAPVRMRLDLPGAILATAGVTLLSYGLVQIGEQSWSSMASLIPLLAGATLLAAFVIVESRVREPLLPLSLFAAPRRVVALLVVLLASAVSATLFFVLALYFLQIRGWSPLKTSAAFVPFGLTLFATAIGVRRLPVQIRPRALATAGLGTAAVGLLLISQLNIDSPYAGTLLAGVLVFQIGATLAFAGCTVAAVDGVPDDEAGLAGGVVNTMAQVGPSAGLALLVSLASAHAATLTQAGVDPVMAVTGGYAFALRIAALTLIVTAAIAVIAWRKTTESEVGLCL